MIYKQHIWSWFVIVVIYFDVNTKRNIVELIIVHNQNKHISCIPDILPLNEKNTLFQKQTLFFFLLFSPLKNKGENKRNKKTNTLIYEKTLVITI